MDKQNSEGPKGSGAKIVAISAFQQIDTVVQLNGLLGNFDIDSAGNIYAINHTTEKIEIYSSDLSLQSTWDIPGGLLPIHQWVQKICVGDSGHVYIGSEELRGIIKFNESGYPIDTLYFGRYGWCWGLARFNDTLFFADGAYKEIVALSCKGDSLFAFSSNWNSQSDWIWSLACDASGNIYVPCMFGDGLKIVQVFNKNGVKQYEFECAYSQNAGISITNDKIAMTTWNRVASYDLHGNLIFRFEVGAPSGNIISPIKAVFNSFGNGNVIVGFSDGYIVRYSRK